LPLSGNGMLAKSSFTTEKATRLLRAKSSLMACSLLHPGAVFKEKGNQ